MIRLIFIFVAVSAMALRVDAQKVLAPSDVLPAMYAALPTTGASIEVVEVSQFPIPDGQIEFSLKDLTPPSAPDRTTRWRGFVRHTGDHKFSIWATVRIVAECQRVISTERIQVGQPILATQLREETYQGYPFAKDATVTAKDLVGRVAKQTINEGKPVHPDATMEPFVIKDGASLTAEVRAGRLRIMTPAVALASGRMGEMINVQNPASKKIFAAQVDGPGRVVVETKQ